MVALDFATPAWAQTKHDSFGYDQPHSTGFGVAGDIFADSLARSSHGAMIIGQSPVPSSARDRKPCERSAPATSIP